MGDSFKFCGLLTISELNVVRSYSGFEDEGTHYVPNRRILFKKSLMVLKDPYGSSEVPLYPRNSKSIVKKIPNHQICVRVFAGFSTFHYIE